MLYLISLCSIVVIIVLVVIITVCINVCLHRSIFLKEVDVGGGGGGMELGTQPVLDFVK